MLPAICAEPALTLMLLSCSVPEAVLLTHAHFDHMGAAAAVCAALQIPLWVGAADTGFLTDPVGNLSGVFGGSSDTFLAKNKAKSMDARLAKITKWVAIAFVVLALVLCFLL